MAQQLLIREALRWVELQPADISYIEAHGTGTPSGDAVEARALAGVFGTERAEELPLFLGSVKGNIGHTEPAAGMAGLIKISLSLRHNLIPAHLNFKAPHPDTGLADTALIIPQHSYSWPASSQPRRASLNSFGLGGTLAHCILEEAPPVENVAKPDPREIEHSLVLSARSEVALKELVERYLSFLRQNPGISLAQLAYTINTGRARLSYQIAPSGSRLEEIIHRLETFWQTEKSAFGPHYLNNLEANEPVVAFIFSKIAAKIDEPDELVRRYEAAEWGRRLGFLPTYPFQRQRYWPTKPVTDLAAIKPSVEKAQEDHPDFKQWLYDLSWDQLVDMTSNSTQNIIPATWLILAGPTSNKLALQIAQELQSHNQSCFWLHPAQGFRRLSNSSYQFNPFELTDFHLALKEVLAQLPGDRPLHILQLAEQTVEPDLTQAHERDCAALLHLT